jgi:hypothetical protein
MREPSAAFVAFSVLLAWVPGFTALQQNAGSPPTAASAQAMNQLSVPAGQLPTGCALAPSSVPLGDGRVVVSAVSLPIPTNPWTGTDRALIAAIRGRMWQPPMSPDGPPLGVREARQYWSRLADGIESGYAAFYDSSAGHDSVGVYAVRFDNEEAIPPRRSGDRHIRIGRTVALVLGGGGAGECHAAIEAYLQSLANERGRAQE